jgi:methylthioribose-1-phosphate isomerase
MNRTSDSKSKLVTQRPDTPSGRAVHPVATLRWEGGIDGHLVFIDQTRLPNELVQLECRDITSLWNAIKELRVRGAPAIGIAAAYGICLGLQSASGGSGAACLHRLQESVDYLATSRPTAANLFWALDRMQRAAAGLEQLPPVAIRQRLLEVAQEIHAEDRAICHAIGRLGAELIEDGAGVLTHCNTGGLATSEYGTALSVLFSAQDDHKNIHVFIGETRPLLQGARLTAWELLNRGISATLICDSAAAQVMKEGRVQLVLTGADRIAANGDTANKIGTYALALLAHAHAIPFYVAAPLSTFDLSLPAGDAIPIEQRPAEEITRGFGQQTAPTGVDVYNPAFDVTPAQLITAIITERGFIRPVDRETIQKVAGS